MERKIQINGTIPGYPKGSIVTVECDNEGTPLDFFWRRQLKHASIDNCCEFVEEKQKARSKSKDILADEEETG